LNTQLNNLPFFTANTLTNNRWNTFLNLGGGYQHLFVTQFSDLTVGVRSWYSLDLANNGLKELNPNNLNFSIYFKTRISKDQHKNRMLKDASRYL
jgi:hypothetical protein